MLATKPRSSLKWRTGCDIVPPRGLQGRNSGVSKAFRDGAFGSFLCSRIPREVAQIQATLDGYLLSMASENVVSGIAESLECRKTLLEVETRVEIFSEHKNLTTF